MKITKGSINLFPSDEKKDVELLNEHQAKVRELAFMMFRDILRMDEKQLHTIGQKTVEGAIVSNIKSYLKQLDALVAAHVKKYPD